MVTPGTLNRRAQLFEQLAAMIAAGVPLTKAMEMAARNRSTGIPRKVLEQLTHHLQEGHTFADAMQLVSGQKRATPQGIEVSFQPGHRACALSEFDVALLSAGEESGRLDATFKLLAHYYAALAKIINDTISGSIITIVTLHVFLVVFPIGFLIAFVQGIVNNQFSQCLPFLIEKAVVFGLLYVGVGSLAFAGQGNRSEGWRSLVESIFSFVPVLRNRHQGSRAGPAGNGAGSADERRRARRPKLGTGRLRVRLAAFEARGSEMDAAARTRRHTRRHGCANQIFPRHVRPALSLRRSQRQNG